MVGYGFAIAGNPFDHYSVGLRVPPGSPLAVTRSWSPERKDEDYKCYIFNVEHPRAISASCLEASIFSFDLLDSISVLSANDRELQTMMYSKRTYMSDRVASKKTRDNRNLLHTFVQLHQECQARLNLLQITKPRAQAEGDYIEPSSPNQRFAHIYRESQSAILATAVALCKYILMQARSQDVTESVFDMLRAASTSAAETQKAIRDVGKLLSQRSTLTRSHELLDRSDLTEALPDPIRSEVHGVLTAQTGMETLVEDSSPAHVSRWIENLMSWYPPDDPNWSALPGKGDEEDIEALLQAIVKTKTSTTGARPLANGSTESNWCTMKRLCWAWNVVGEESVQVPCKMLPCSTSGPNGDRKGVETFLYVPSM